MNSTLETDLCRCYAKLIRNKSSATLWWSTREKNRRLLVQEKPPNTQPYYDHLFHLGEAQTCCTPTWQLGDGRTKSEAWRDGLLRSRRHLIRTSSSPWLCSRVEVAELKDLISLAVSLNSSYPIVSLLGCFWTLLLFPWRSVVFCNRMLARWNCVSLEWVCPDLRSEVNEGIGTGWPCRLKVALVPGFEPGYMWCESCDDKMDYTRD